MIWTNVTKFGQNFIAPKFFWAGTAMDSINIRKRKMKITRLYIIIRNVHIFNRFLILKDAFQFQQFNGGLSPLDWFNITSRRHKHCSS